MALKNGLDPDTTLPEDIILLNEDDKGNLEVFNELETAKRKMVFEREQCRIKAYRHNSNSYVKK